MSESGDALNEPAMALTLTEEGKAASYAPMEMGDPSGAEIEKADAAARPGGDQEVAEGVGGRYGNIL